jgi:hypothetical protein
MTTAEEDVIRAECQEWAGGLLHIDSDDRREGLRDRICANPDAWWRILQELIAEAPDDQVIQRLAYAPLRMTLECGGERLLQRGGIDRENQPEDGVGREGLAESADDRPLPLVRPSLCGRDAGPALLTADRLRLLGLAGRQEPDQR